MERLGTLCATALVVAACSFALTGCNNIDGKPDHANRNSAAPKPSRKPNPR